MKNKLYDATFSINGMSVKVSVRERRIGRYIRDYTKKTRVYVSVEEENMAENLAFRCDRPYKEYRKYAVPALQAYFGMDQKPKLGWSQYAGCTMCPCSPGFIWKEGAPAGFGKSHDIWITLAADAPKYVVEDAEAAERIAGRAEVAKGLFSKEGV